MVMALHFLSWSTWYPWTRQWNWSGRSPYQ